MRRAEFRRTARLEPGPPPRRKARMGRGEPKPRKGRTRAAGTASGMPKPPRKFTPRVRLLAFTRAGGGNPHLASCECCGTFPNASSGPLELQHRAARGSGGCRAAVIQSPANAAVMCQRCHARAEARDRGLRDDAAGFWIRYGTTREYDPRNVPILLAGESGGGLTVFLAADGLGPDGTGYLLQQPEARAA